MINRLETFGWRGKIGFVSPAKDWCGGSEYYPLLPEGVALDVVTTGVATLQAEDFENAISLYLPSAKHLAAQECDVVVIGAAAVFSYAGPQRAQETMKKIRQEVNIPVLLNLEAQFDALRAFGAKKLAMITPYEEPRNLERKALCEAAGFDVIKWKSLGLKRRIDFEKAPHYTTYRLAREVIAEAPEADAVYISCPEWPTVRNIAKIERDTGKPVVAPVPSLIWAALRTIGIKEPVCGFGRLMEMV